LQAAALRDLHNAVAMGLAGLAQGNTRINGEGTGAGDAEQPVAGHMI